MAKQLIDLGTTDNDGTGNTLKAGGTKINDNFDEVYAWTGWMSRTDATPATLTGAVNNFIVLTGTPEGNNGLTLLDATSRITPISLGDAITVDFSVTIETPSGTGNYIEVAIFIPGGGFYRAHTMPLVRGAGNDQIVTVSFTLPVGATFLANGADVVLIPNVTVTGKDFYINVTQVHKGQ